MLNFAMLTPLFADNFDGLFWLAVGGVLVAVFVFGLVTLFTSRYKRCPSNRVLVIYGKAGRRRGGQVHPRRRRIRAAADSGLRLPEPGADADRNSAARRAVDGEHPRQRAQRVHRRHRHHAGGDAERGHPLAWAGRRRDQEAGRAKSSSASCGR